MKMMDIYQFLADHDIEYERYDHPPVFTCEEANRLVPPLPAAKTRNLFARPPQSLLSCRMRVIMRA
jgi:Ala-tRNA(Pro) deacylase